MQPAITSSSGGEASLQPQITVSESNSAFSCEKQQCNLTKYDQGKNVTVAVDLRQHTHFLLSWWNCIFSLNLPKLTFSSPDQFSSSIAGPSFAASAPGCLSLRSKGTSRTSSDTVCCSQQFIRPNTILTRGNRVAWQCVIQGTSDKYSCYFSKHLYSYYQSGPKRAPWSCIVYGNVSFEG